MDSDSGSGRRDRNVAAVRARIVLAGKALLAEGAPEVTVGAIAERADVAVATFYNHFESRDAFVEAIAAVQIDAVARAVAAILSAAEAPHVALAMLTKSMTMTAAHLPEELRFAMLVLRGMAPRADPIGQLVRDVIIEGVTEGIMTTVVDPVLAAAMYRNAVSAAIVSSIANGADGAGWKDIVYPSLRMLGVDRHRITDAVSAAHAWVPPSEVVTGVVDV